MEQTFSERELTGKWSRRGVNNRHVIGEELTKAQVFSERSRQRVRKCFRKGVDNGSARVLGEEFSTEGANGQVFSERELSEQVISEREIILGKCFRRGSRQWTSVLGEEVNNGPGFLVTKKTTNWRSVFGGRVDNGANVFGEGVSNGASVFRDGAATRQVFSERQFTTGRCSFGEGANGQVFSERQFTTGRCFFGEGANGQVFSERSGQLGKCFRRLTIVQVFSERESTTGKGSRRGN